MIAVGTALTVLVISLTGATPTWWRPVDANDPAVKAAADTLENGVVNQLHAQRPSAAMDSKPRNGVSWQSEPWTVALHEADAMLFLMERPTDWARLKELAADQLKLAEDWLGRQRRFWERRLDTGHKR